MAHLDHLEQLRTQNQRRLQKLEEQHARAGYSTDPVISLEIEDIQQELATLDADICAHSKLLNLFKRYESGYAELLNRLGIAGYGGQILTFQNQLRVCIDRVREAGDTPDRQAERNRIVQEIDTFAIEQIGESFFELSGTSSSTNADDLPPPALPPSTRHRPSGLIPDTATTIGSISAQNLNFGNQTIGTQINLNTTNYYHSSQHKHPGARQSSAQASLEEHILRLERAVKEQAAPELIEQVRERILELQRAFRAVDVSKMVIILMWFDQHLPMFSNTVRDIICHPIIRRRVIAAGREAVREFQQRFGSCYDYQEPENE